MYIEAVLKGYRLLDVPQNPGLRESLKDKSLLELEQILAGYKVLHNKTDVDTAQRAIRAIEIEEYYKNEAPDVNEYDPINSLIIGIDIDRELRREKISRRLRVRLDEGMVNEVRKIIDSGVKPEDLIYYGLEYKYLTLYIIGKLSYEDMISQLEISIHQVCQTANDLVQRHGAPGKHYPLDRCYIADRRKDREDIGVIEIIRIFRLTNQHLQFKSTQF